MNRAVALLDLPCGVTVGLELLLLRAQNYEREGNAALVSHVRSVTILISPYDRNL